MQITRLKRSALAAALALAFAESQAATFTSDFNSGVPANSTVYGNTVVEATGGVGDSGVLKLTKAINSQSGAYIIEDIDGGAAVYGFKATFKARVGGGTATPADGFSMSFGPDLPDGPFSEDGAGSGLTIGFDTYVNAGEPSPQIELRVGRTVVATFNTTIPGITTGADYADVMIEVSPAGVLNMTYKGQAIFTNLVIPGYQALSGRFGFGARTGGANANHFIDDLTITTYLTPQSAFSQQPRSIAARLGSDVTLSTQITNPDGATFQWFKGETAVSRATSSTLTIPAVTLADNNAQYKVRVTGPNNTITSEVATLTVVDIPLPAAPQLSIDFNDGVAPAGTMFNDAAYIEANGGVGDSGVLKLTYAENNLFGSYVINDINAGATIYGFTASFDALIGGGTEVPADGFSFNLVETVPAAITGELEEGIAGGLTVAFDVYDNGGGEAPSIDIKYLGTVIASAKIPRSEIITVDQYVPVIVRMEANGTMDVVFNNVVVHNNVYVPGFASMAGPSAVFAARTGGLNANFWIDNIKLTTTLTPSELRLTTQPSNTTVLVGAAATFTGEVNDATGVTYQWLRNGVAISGATSASYTLNATTAADAGARFQLQATKNGVTVTSDEVTLGILNLAVPTVPTVTFDFNNATLPAATAIFGNAEVAADGGVDNSGVMVLTRAENGLNGAFVINPLLAGAELSGFTASFDVLIGGGSAVPADGMSFNFAPNIPLGTIGGAEEGGGSGLTIAFDIYNNGATETTPAPSVDVKWNGQIIGTTQLSIADISTGDTFRRVLVRLSADGKVDLAYGDRVLQNGLQIPNYSFVSNGRFGFYARTGGLNANQFVDNVRIEAVKSALPLRIGTEPTDATVLAGKTASFTVVLSDPIGATYVWSRNGVIIPGATTATLTTPVLSAADSGATYQVVATGPGGTVTSRAAVVAVIPTISVTNPSISFNFEDGVQPEGTSVAGTALVNAGYVALTEAVNDQNGAFHITDPTLGAAASGFTAQFKIRAGGGTSTPADGFAFVWSEELDPTVTFGEDGAGTGLTVSFDTYDNGGGEAPAIDVYYRNELIASRKLPIGSIMTGDEFATGIIRVEADGTFDLHYKDQVIYNNLALPGYRATTGGSFAFGARTGGLNAAHYVDDVQIAVSTGALAPNITGITLQGANVTIQWTGGGTLQAAATLNGPWADLVGATSPHQTATSGAMRFFRVKQ